jgi:lysophospholipase L1-like esterase
MGETMADYQEYRRKVLGRRRRRVLRTAALLVLAVLLAGGGCAVWLRARMARGENAAAEDPLAPVSAEAMAETTAGNMEWNSLAYAASEGLSVLQNADGTTAMDWRLAALPASDAVALSYFDQVAFLGDSITQGLEIYETGLPNATYCAYKGVGPNAVVAGSTCTRVDGTEEVPLEALAAANPKAVYILLGTNVLTRDTELTSFLAYYGLMLDEIRELLPDANIYVQSITPVRPEVCEDENHDGMYTERFVRANNELAALALEKGCYFLDLWSFLADENGDLREEYAQPDGYHIKAETYTLWVDYLRTHTVYTPWAEYATETSDQAED